MRGSATPETIISLGAACLAGSLLLITLLDVSKVFRCYELTSGPVLTQFPIYPHTGAIGEQYRKVIGGYSGPPTLEFLTTDAPEQVLAYYEGTLQTLDFEIVETLPSQENSLSFSRAIACRTKEYVHVKAILDMNGTFVEETHNIIDEK